MKKPVILYLSNPNNPVDLESLDTCTGKIEFESLSSAFDFINYDVSYSLVGNDYDFIHASYNVIQKKMQRYGYFKAYTYINNRFFSYMIKYV